MSDGKLWYFPLYLHALQFFFLQSQQNFPIYWYISKIYPAYQNQKLLWGIERSGFFNGREKWAKDFENQRV